MDNTHFVTSWYIVGARLGTVVLRSMVVQLCCVSVPSEPRRGLGLGGYMGWGTSVVRVSERSGAPCCLFDPPWCALSEGVRESR